MQLLEGKRKRKYSHVLFVWQSEEPHGTECTKKGVFMKRSGFSFHPSALCDFQAVPHLSKPPCLLPALVSCLPFLFTYFLLCWSVEQLEAGTIPPKMYLCQLAKPLPCEPFALSGEERHLTVIQSLSRINNSSLKPFFSPWAAVGT